MSKQYKQQNGVFYTNLNNPFDNKYFIDWSNNLEITDNIILEPFAGANNIIDKLKEIELCNQFSSFDINPTNQSVKVLDTIANFPTGYNICITNPPWLYKSRAKRLGLDYPESKWDNLYKHCLDLCLQHCNYVAILIPASFITANIFLDRLDSVHIFNSKLFSDTDNPVCLALFNKANVSDSKIFMGNKDIGTLSELKRFLPESKDINISFNEVNGDLGLVAIDNTKQASIKFCKGEELTKYNITHSSRSITRITVNKTKITDNLINNLNRSLNDFRKNTYDIFMTAFKGLRADGCYRRRLDYSLAKKIICSVI